MQSISVSRKVINFILHKIEKKQKEKEYMMKTVQDKDSFAFSIT